MLCCAIEGPHGRLFLFVIFFVFFKLSLFFAKQVIDPSAFGSISDLFEHCPVMLDVLPYDKTLHKDPPAGRIEPG
jgi:hypothetical protein